MTPLCVLHLDRARSNTRGGGRPETEGEGVSS
eukprot:CAMPEP_0177196536 /NCGR_PEP_ID=MMETSP0367-20130122/24095_1 /TAXON_ID=447022 ORGANISM="Scrippsiella hangoei-like, Strain SHHI-4" /NCGR_SAMPLE_ID=MMETSP0367 /ASSEMBLY_ACC=CAM_ASM_000362 /LENGTH=31 /DNA_ID= /DNA_START= /DNA_END= /DNA_ORIENTATION=